MTVFSLRGSKIQTDLNGQITEIQDTDLEVITRIGTNSLDVAYLGDPQNPLAISLSDYNLKLDNVHMNDADLPSQIEFFDLSANDSAGMRVINFVFETSNGIEERMFSVGQTPLPTFTSPSEASLFFAQHEPLMIAAQDDWTIQFAQINNVKTSGVFVDINHLGIEDFQVLDGFDFFEIIGGTDIDVWDIEFAEAAHLQDATASALGNMLKNADQADLPVDTDNPEYFHVEINDGQ